MFLQRKRRDLTHTHTQKVINLFWWCEFYFLMFFFFSDQLNVQLYKADVKDVHKRQPKANFNIEGFFGLETGFSYDKETNVLAIVCQKQVTLFSFENRDNLIQFEIKIRRSLGEGTKSWKKNSFC